MKLFVLSKCLFFLYSNIDYNSKNSRNSRKFHPWNCQIGRKSRNEWSSRRRSCNCGGQRIRRSVPTKLSENCGLPDHLLLGRQYQIQNAVERRPFHPSEWLAHNGCKMMGITVNGSLRVTLEIDLLVDRSSTIH